MSSTTRGDVVRRGVNRAIAAVVDSLLCQEAYCSDGISFWFRCSFSLSLFWTRTTNMEQARFEGEKVSNLHRKAAWNNRKKWSGNIDYGENGPDCEFTASNLSATPMGFQQL